jgi:hypothetical protein
VDVFYDRSKRPIGEVFSFVDGERDDEKSPSSMSECQP